MDGGREQVHAHQGQVGRRIGGFFHQAHDAALAIEHGHAELPGVVHGRQQDGAGGAAAGSGMGTPMASLR